MAQGVAWSQLELTGLNDASESRGRLWWPNDWTIAVSHTPNPFTEPRVPRAPTIAPSVPRSCLPTPIAPQQVGLPDREPAIHSHNTAGGVRRGVGRQEEDCAFQLVNTAIAFQGGVGNIPDRTSGIAALAAVCAVWKEPGEMAFTRMPYCAHSEAMPGSGAPPQLLRPRRSRCVAGRYCELSSLTWRSC